MLVGSQEIVRGKSEVLMVVINVACVVDFDWDLSPRDQDSLRSNLP